MTTGDLRENKKETDLSKWNGRILTYQGQKGDIIYCWDVYTVYEITKIMIKVSEKVLHIQPFDIQSVINMGYAPYFYFKSTC